MVNQIICRCKCKPKLEFHHSNYKGYIVGLTVIHNSFDGREAVEWANDILKESDREKPVFSPPKFQFTESVFLLCQVQLIRNSEMKVFL